MAKSLIRNRHAVTKLYSLKSQLQAVSLQMQVRAAVKPALDSTGPTIMARSSVLRFIL